MSGVLRTPRLDLLPWPEHHSGLVAELTSDLRVMRYIGTGDRWDADRVAGLVAAKREDWATLGYGWRVAVRREDGTTVGLATTGPLGDGVPGLDPGEHELGWWIAAGHWGHGYAGELALAIRAEAHEVVGSASVLARVQPANIPSVKVAEHAGLIYERDILGRFGETNVLYRGTADGWQDAAAAR